MPSTNLLVKKCVATIHKLIPHCQPKIGLILSPGLEGLVEHLEQAQALDYQYIDGFYVSALEGYVRKLHYGFLNGVPVICLAGSTKLHEGEHALESLKITIRTLKLLGCEILLTTDTVGALKEHTPDGSLMLIEDHINFTFQDPLSGANDNEFGNRFISMANAYDAQLREQFLAVAHQRSIPVSAGVYVATLGPSFETYAERRMFQLLGASAIGMSIVPETILAKHCGLKVVAVCILASLVTRLSNAALLHDTTNPSYPTAATQLTTLLVEFIATLR